MSVNIALNRDTWDIEEINGAIHRVFDSRQVLQLVETRILTIQQEWFLDLSSGLPWYTEMMGRHTDVFTIRSYLSDEIIDTPGVESIQNIEADYDSLNRKLAISYKFTDIFGIQASGNL